MSNIKLTAIKSLNNNIIVCRKDDGKEVIAFGKGIGFNKTPGEEIELDKIEKIYEFTEKINLVNYASIVENNEEKLSEVTEHVLSVMSDVIGNCFSEKLHITLLDHLAFAIKRDKENISIPFMFLEETRFMYPKEFAFSEWILKEVNNNLNVNLKESEIGFICMHIHAAIQNSEVSTVTLISNVVSETINYLENIYNYNLKQDDILKQRLITHLKFAIKRSIDKISLDNPIASTIKRKYSHTYKVASNLAKNINDKYGILLNEAEICYLTVHIQNIIYNVEEKNVRKN